MMLSASLQSSMVRNAICLCRLAAAVVCTRMSLSEDEKDFVVNLYDLITKYKHTTEYSALAALDWKITRHWQSWIAALL